MALRQSVVEAFTSIETAIETEYLEQQQLVEDLEREARQ